MPVGPASELFIPLVSRKNIIAAICQTSVFSSSGLRLVRWTVSNSSGGVAAIRCLVRFVDVLSWVVTGRIGYSCIVRVGFKGFSVVGEDEASECVRLRGRFDDDIVGFDVAVGYWVEAGSSPHLAKLQDFTCCYESSYDLAYQARRKKSGERAPRRHPTATIYITVKAG
jgi:hypothetical protein